MREKIFFFLLVLGFGILLVKLFVLQIIQGDYWAKLAEGNRIRVQKISALRGIVYDRKNQVLVRNTPTGREYLNGRACAHILGYIAEVSQEELENSEPGLSAGDIVGKSGIEKEYDSRLRGKDGGILEEVDAQANVVRALGKNEPIAGESLYLTIDLDLQQKAYQVLAGKRGAVVASVPKTGEILALVSSPSYDPNIFTIQSSASAKATADKQKDIEAVFSDESQPMFDRALSGLYPPGSTFKIVTAIAGLEEAKIDDKTHIEDTGQINVGGRTFGNWYFKQYGKTEGSLDLVGAIRRSNDIFFYTLGSWLGIDKLSQWAHKFGLGEDPGIDLPGALKGLVPDKTWKKKAKGEDWYTGDDFNTAIGQGDLLVTPLQLNRMTSVVVSDGKLCPPSLLKPKDSNWLKVGTRQKCLDLKIKEEYLKLVKEGMKQACSTGGTGWPFFDFGTGGPSTSSADFKRIEVGCKTGTAESSGKNNNPHAWFTLVAPIAEPQIVLTVLVENGGEGSSVAGPIAKDILKWWFEEK